MVYLSLIREFYDGMRVKEDRCILNTKSTAEQYQKDKLLEILKEWPDAGWSANEPNMVRFCNEPRTIQFDIEEHEILH